MHRNYIIKLDKINVVIENVINLRGNHIMPMGEDYKAKILDYATVRLLRPIRIS